MRTDWHVLIVTEEIEDHPDRQVIDHYTDILHPESCPLKLFTQVDPVLKLLRQQDVARSSIITAYYECPIAVEIDATGLDLIFPDGPKPGWYRVMAIINDYGDEVDVEVELAGKFTHWFADMLKEVPIAL